MANGDVVYVPSNKQVEEFPLHWGMYPSFDEVKWSGRFYPYDARKRYSEYAGISVEVHGWDDVGRVVTANFAGHLPYFYCRSLDGAVTDCEVLKKAFNGALRRDPTLFRWQPMQEDNEGPEEENAPILVNTLFNMFPNWRVGEDNDEKEEIEDEDDEMLADRIAKKKQEAAEQKQLLQAVVRERNSWDDAETKKLLAGELEPVVDVVRVRGREADEPFALKALIHEYFKVYCKAPQVVSACRRASTERRLSLPGGGLVFSESKVDYVVRVLADNGFRPGCWYSTSDYATEAAMEVRRATLEKCNTELSKKRKRATYEILGDKDEVEIDEERQKVPSEVGLHLKGQFSDFKSLKDQGLPEPILKNLSFDIEVVASNQRFPSADRDRVNLICAHLWKTGDALNARSYSFMLIRPSEIGADKALLEKIPEACEHVWAFEAEGDLLSSFRNFVLHSDPDTISAHNGNGFDIDYLLKRTRALQTDRDVLVKPLRFEQMGRAQLSARAPYYPRISVREGMKRLGRSIHMAFVDGRLVFDTMMIAAEEGGDMRLGAQAEKFLKSDKCKEDLEISQMENLQMTAPGRSRILRYCERDSRIVAELMEVKSSVIMTCATSNLCGLVPQSTLNRGATARAETAVIFKLAETPIVPDTAPDFLREFLSVRPILSNHGVFDVMRRAHYTRKSFPGEHAKETPDGGIVYEPKRGYYREMVIVLDFTSLYPMLMQSLNISPDTFIALSDALRHGLVEGEHFMRVPGWEKKLEAEPGAEVPCFLRSSVFVGVMSQIEGETMSLRSVLRAEMRELQARRDARKEQNEEELTEINLLELKAEQHVMQLKIASLNAHQLSAKLLGNGLYGVLLSSFSILFNSIVARSIPLAGRDGLDKMDRSTTDKFINVSKIYGDTDSVFFKLPDGTTLDEAGTLGYEIKDAIDDFFQSNSQVGQTSLSTKFEKIIVPLALNKKKCYIGAMINMEIVGRKGKVSEAPITLLIAGLQIKKSNTLPFVRAIGSQLADVLFMHPDWSEAERLEKGIDIVKETSGRLVRHELTVSDLVECTNLHSKISSYKAGLDKSGKKKSIPAHVSAAKREVRRVYEAEKKIWDALPVETRKRKQEPREEDFMDTIYREGDRVYTIRRSGITGRREKVGPRLEHPLYFNESGLTPDWKHYFEQMLKIIEKAFALVFDALSGQENYLRVATRPFLSLITNQPISGPMSRFLRPRNCPVCNDFRLEVRDGTEHYRAKSDLVRSQAEWARRNVAARAYCRDSCFCGQGAVSDIENCAAFICPKWGERKMVEGKLKQGAEKIMRFCQ